MSTRFWHRVLLEASEVTVKMPGRAFRGLGSEGNT
jgi:hypothetical protein